MHDNEGSDKAGPVQRKGRHEQTTRSVAELLDGQDAAPPAVVSPPREGQRDIRVIQQIRLETIDGTVFQKEETTVLAGMLDPSNRGHMASAMEAHFASMCRMAVHAFNQVLDDKYPEQPVARKRQPSPMALSSVEVPQASLGKFEL